MPCLPHWCSKSDHLKEELHLFSRIKEDTVKKSQFSCHALEIKIVIVAINLPLGWRLMSTSSSWSSYASFIVTRAFCGKRHTQVYNFCSLPLPSYFWRIIIHMHIFMRYSLVAQRKLIIGSRGVIYSRLCLTWQHQQRYGTNGANANTLYVNHAVPSMLID